MLKMPVFQGTFLDIFVYTEHKEPYFKITDPWLVEGEESTEDHVIWKQIKDFLKYLESIFWFLKSGNKDLQLNTKMKITK